MIPNPDFVFFDFFETLGSEVAGSPDQRLEDFDAYASASEFLTRIGARARLGVLSLDPDIPVDRLRGLLEEKGLSPPIDPALVAVAPRGADDPFARLLAQVGLSERDQPVFVSLDARHRSRATASGLRVAPHPELVRSVLEGEALHYARLFGRGREEPNWASIVDNLAVVPVHRTREPEPALYAIASSRALDKLAEPPFADAVDFERLAGPEVVEATTLVMLRITREEVSADAELQSFVSNLESRLPLVRQTPRGLMVAFPGERSADELHPPPAGAAHGHTRALLPDPGLVHRPRRRVRLGPRALRDEERRGFDGLDADAFGRALESWTGL